MGLPSVGLNTAFAALTNLLGVRADPYQSFNFLVEIEGILAGGFSECSGLQVVTESLDYREGGVNEYMHRFAGPTRYPSLILKHGLTQIDGLWNWHQDMTQGNIQRKNGTVYLLDQQRVPVMFWNFKQAFPINWTGPDFSAESGAIAIESVELAHHGLSRPTLGGLAGTAGSAVSGAAGVAARALGF